MYKTSYVCLPCRHVAQYQPDVSPRCPHCSAAMRDVGHDFQAPKKQDDSGWRAVQATLDAGLDYHSCGCEGPGPRPREHGEANRWFRPRRKKFADNA